MERGYGRRGVYVGHFGRRRHGVSEGRFGRAKQPSPRDELRFLCVPRIDEPPFAELACGSDSRSMAVISAERTTKTSAMSANYALLPLPRPCAVSLYGGRFLLRGRPPKGLPESAGVAGDSLCLSIASIPYGGLRCQLPAGGRSSRRRVCRG